MRNAWVEKDLEFRADASHAANIKGPMKEVKRHQSDRFTGIAIDTTNEWAVAVPGTDDTIAISEVQGGSVLMTTGSGATDSCMLSTAIIYSGSKKAAVEWRITISDVSGCAVFAGFSDAKSQTNTNVAIHYPSDVLATVAVNAAGFVIDGSHATSSIMCCGVKGGTDETPVDSGTDWADGETKVLRVELGTDPEGNLDGATFYLDGTVVGHLDDAVTAATLLCATVQVINREAAANTVYVKSFDAWQDD